MWEVKPYLLVTCCMFTHSRYTVAQKVLWDCGLVLTADTFKTLRLICVIPRPTRPYLTAYLLLLTFRLAFASMTSLWRGLLLLKCLTNQVRQVALLYFVQRHRRIKLVIEIKHFISLSCKSDENKVDRWVWNKTRDTFQGRYCKHWRSNLYPILSLTQP